jgi:hypothetical protein
MIDYILRLLLPASMALAQAPKVLSTTEALKKPLEAPETVNEGQGSLNHVKCLKPPYNQ